MTSPTSRIVDDCVRTILHNCRSIPVRVPQRAPSGAPPRGRGEVVTADDLHRFEWVVRARVAAAVRSALASARKKQTATTSKGKP